MERLELAAGERLYFISDLHLCATRPATTAAFFSFLGHQARQADDLFILGDLFDAWPGDDDDSPLAGQVADALSACRAAGTRCLFMHGNRDFLLGEAYATRAGLELLADPTPLTIGPQSLLLLHGDTLCIDDHPYQAFRRQVRDPRWQAEFLARPLAERRAVIAGARSQSEAAKRSKDLSIMDASEAAIAELLSASGNPTLIHGHTHRMACHRQVVDGRPSVRWVLPEWHDHAHFLAWQNGDATFVALPPPAGR